jgi:lipoprotein-releasing system permease protein
MKVAQGVDDDVLAVQPFIFAEMLVTRGKGQLSGVGVKGVDPARVRGVLDIEQHMIEGSIDSLGTGRPSGPVPPIIIGKELASSLGIVPGDEIVLMTPTQELMVPKMAPFRVAGLFKSGMYEYDANLILVSLGAAQRLFSTGDSVSGIGVSLTDSSKAASMERVVAETLSYPYIVRSWERMNHNLFAALKLEKIMMFIILALIILVAAFNIISNLLLLTVEKSKEVGILSALGLRRIRIATVFFYEGLIIGVSGIILGSGLGIGICLLLKKYQFIHLPADVYYLDTLPVRILTGDVLSVVGATLIITLLAAIYPAYQVTKLDPLEAVRYG